MMNLSGRIKDIQLDYFGKKVNITFEVNEKPVGIEDLKDTELSISIGKYRKARSLDSNAYFHVLCDKLRQKIGVSMAEEKNDLITRYGQIEYIAEGEPAVVKTNLDPDLIKENESLHMKFLKFGEDGAFWYRIYRGSHTYNTAEMAKLIEGTILECQEYGIETATPDEIARMQALWEKKHGST